ncbi:MAG: hypothetical protein RLY86_3330 [Pseudomonadota bacterium]|jgi:hypothetical protein
MRRLLSPAFLLAALCLTTGPALSQAAGQPAPAGFGFADKRPVTLAVAEVIVQSDYVPPVRDPYVDHLIPVTPTDAVRLWAQDRLRTGAADGTARIIVKEASVMEVPLERTEGVRGWFTKDQSERYTGKLTVEIVVDTPSLGQGIASANVSRSTTVPEDVSLAEREKVMLTLVRDLIRDLDTQLEPAIRTHLAPMVVE